MFFMAWAVVSLLSQVAVGSIEGRVTRTDTGVAIPSLILSIGVQSVETDADGRFMFDKLSPGSYRINVGTSGNLHYSGSPRAQNPVTLWPGQSLRDINLSLMPSPIVGGRITEVDGKPASGLQVRALTRSYIEGRLSLRAVESMRTNDQGEYRFTALDPGDYYIRVEAGGAETYFPGVDDFGKAEVVAANSARELSSVDFTRLPRSERRVSGILNGMPSNVENFAVAFFLVPRDRSIPAPTGVRVNHTFDPSSGAFTVDAAAPGSYQLFAWISDDVAMRLRGQFLYPPNSAYTGHVPIDIVGNQQLERVNLSLHPARDLNGKIMLTGGLDVTLLGKLNIYLRPLHLSLETEFPINMDGAVRRGQISDSNGVFAFTQLPDGRYGVSIDGLPEDAYIADIRQNDASVYDLGILLRPDVSAPVEVIIGAGGRTISGVLEEEGRPSPSRAVVLVPSAPRRMNLMFYRTVNTDVAGRFTFRGVVPGDYRLFAWESTPRGAQLNPEFIGRSEDKGVLVNVEERDVAGVAVHLIGAEVPAAK